MNWQRTLWIMFVAQVCSTIGFASIFPFLPLYVADLGSSTGLSIEFWAGMVFSGQAIAMAIASPIWGAVADRYGRKLMVERAMFGGTIFILLMAFVTSAEQLVFLRILQGAVTGTISAANALVAAIAPRERMGYAMGVLQVGFWLGIAIGPIIGGVLADAFGYRPAFIVTAVLLFIAGLIVFFFIKEDRKPDAASRKNQPNVLHEWGSILKTPGVGMTYFLRFLGATGQTVIIPTLPLFILALLPEEGSVGTVTGLAVGVASATSTASAIYLGRLGDRIGHRNVLIGGAALAAICYFPQSMVTTAWQLLLLQALTGIGLGGIIPSISALLAHYTRPGEEGSVYGLEASITSLSRAVAPLIGASVAFYFGLEAIFIAAGAIFGLTALGAWLLLPARPAPQSVQTVPGD